MSISTAGTLDSAIMMRIKEIVLAKFGKRRSAEDKEASVHIYVNHNYFTLPASFSSNLEAQPWARLS